MGCGGLWGWGVCEEHDTDHENSSLRAIAGPGSKAAVNFISSPLKEYMRCAKEVDAAFDAVGITGEARHPRTRLKELLGKMTFAFHLE